MEQALLFDFVAHFARVSPDKLAVLEVETGRRLTYAELDERIDKAAELIESLLERDIGDRVAVLSRNSAEMLVLHFACVRSGSIFVPLNWRLTARELDEIIDDAEPSLLLVAPQFLPAVAHRPEPRIMIDESPDGLAARIGATPCPRARGTGIAVPANRPITLLYSSGTTGKPKGVIVTYLNAFSGALNLVLGTRCSPDCVFLCEMPMFHTAGLFAAARAPLLAGGRVVISGQFDAERTYRRLADPELGITHYFAVTQMAMMMRQLPEFDGKKLARLTALVTGGAPNPPAHVLRWLDDGVMMLNGWGMSETCSTSLQPIGSLDRLRENPGAVGFPHLTVEMKVVREDGREAGIGEVGEIWVRGANVTPGYWRRPALNETAFVDGWFLTGDAAVRHEDGTFSIVDRKKDMFISGGENVYPVEVEAAIAEIGGIGDVAVVGIPDERWGEVGCAWIVPAAGVTLEAGEILAHCLTRLARYKVPKRIEIVDHLPRTPSGKVQKHLLRAQLIAAGAG
jgi:fatty-acyl-CoA synthase